MEWLAHIEPGHVITAVTAVIVALLGSRLWDTIASRGKNDADAAKVIVEAAGEAITLQIAAAKAECAEAIRHAVAESEQRCQDRVALRKAERDRQLDDLKAQIRESCEARKAMKQELADLRELLESREDEMRQMIDSAGIPDADHRLQSG